jgi:hypothetical protein
MEERLRHTTGILDATNKLLLFYLDKQLNLTIPLPSGHNAELHIPRRLTQADFDMLTAFLATIRRALIDVPDVRAEFAAIQNMTFDDAPSTDAAV